MAYKKGLSTSTECNPDHVDVLRLGIPAWNAWRAENPDIVPNLAGCDFTDEKVWGETPIWQGENATSVKPKFGYCKLDNANFSGAYMRGCSFVKCDINKGNFESAKLIFADFRNSEPWDCNLTDADLGGANLAGADFGGVIYNRSKMRRNYLSIRGASEICGDAVFRRDILDQDYLDTIDFRILRRLSNEGSFWKKIVQGFWSISPLLGALFGLIIASIISIAYPQLRFNHAIFFSLGFAILFALLRTPYGERFFFEVWGLFDFGRSWRRVGVFGLSIIIIFGAVFSILGPEHVAFSGSNDVVSASINLESHPLHPYVFSAAGFVSGGLLGLAGVQSNIGLLCVILNGLFGIGTFGLFLSTLSTTFSRQS